MAETIHGSSVSWGIASAETGGLIQNLEIEDKVDEREIRDNKGAVCTHISYNRMKIVSGSFFTTSAADISAITPSAAYAFANVSDSAAKIVTNVKTTLEVENAKKIDFEAKIYPAITS